MFEIFLGIVFVASLGFLWIIVGKKIPMLLAVPESEISEYFYNPSSRIHFLFSEIYDFFWRGYYKLWFWRLLEKTILRLRVLILRFDNLTAHWLRRVKERIGNRQEFNANGGQISSSTTAIKAKAVYWDILKGEGKK